MIKQSEIDKMGTHMYTRGTRGRPRSRALPKEMQRLIKPHPRLPELTRRREAFVPKHDGVHKPGAIHSRGGRA